MKLYDLGVVAILVTFAIGSLFGALVEDDKNIIDEQNNIENNEKA